MKVLITSGGTKIPIDRVRDITNMSTGTFGSKIATEVLNLGHNVVFYRAKNSKSPMSVNVDIYKKNVGPTEYSEWLINVHKNMSRYMEYEYSTFDQYSEGLKFIIGVEQPDIIVLAAAVSDYGIENYFSGKMRSNDLFTIKLKQLPKLINRVKEWAPNAKLVGFKLLVDSKLHDLLAAAKRSVDENACDMVVANDLDDIKNNNHRVHLVFKNKTISYEASKDETNPNYLANVVANSIVNL